MNLGWLDFNTNAPKSQEKIAAPKNFQRLSRNKFQQVIDEIAMTCSQRNFNSKSLESQQKKAVSS